ncbi:MAG TPA: hypothetical protein VEQ42_01400 [Pyrinomonadaceae bacterium]|nr:hypothetical protein [Pyrinomonadaceae bacterium]
MEAQKKAVLIRPPQPCHWGPTDECLRNGKITRLSVTYQTCYIQTKAPAADGQAIYLQLWLPDEVAPTRALANDVLLLQGKVKNYSPKVGFSLQFEGLSDGEESMLTMLVEHYSDKS